MTFSDCFFLEMKMEMKGGMISTMIRRGSKVAKDTFDFHLKVIEA